MDNIIINNNVNLDVLYNNFSWIHGNTKENIEITIFLITIQGHQLKYALNAINNLNLNYPVLVNVIMNISPTNKAYNMMRERCITKYFIQLDEDMELFPNAIEIFLRNLKKYYNNKIFCYGFKLIDYYLGCGSSFVLDQLKIYNNDIMKKYPTYNDGNISVSSVDRMWHTKILEDGYYSICSNNILAYHARKRNGFDLIIRFSKNTDTMMNNSIKKTSGDFCRYIRPINKINNLDNVYEMILNHFVYYDAQKYNFNKNKLYEVLKKRYIPIDSLNLYIIKHNYQIIPNFDFNFNFKNFIELTYYNLENVNEYFCIIGIINKLFENYEYSYDKYPYEIYNYFKKIFNYRLLIIVDNIEKYKDELNLIFQNYEFIEYFIIDNNSNDYGIIDNIINYNGNLTIDTITFENDEKFINHILNKTRKNKCKILSDINNIDNSKGYQYFLIDNSTNITYKNNIFYINEQLYNENIDCFIN